jgi:hypothetical protein
MVDNKTSFMSKSSTGEDIYQVDLVKMSETTEEFMLKKLDVAKKEFCRTHESYHKYSFYFYGEMINGSRMNTFKSYRYFEITGDKSYITRTGKVFFTCETN